MKKFILFLLILVVLVGAAAVIVLAGSLDGKIHDAIETTGTEMLGEPVQVGGVSISLTNGSGEITGLRVANPEGYTDPNAMAVGKILLDVDLTSVAGSPKRLNEFILESPEVYLEVLEDDRLNFEELAPNLQQQIESAPPPEADTESEDSEEDPADVLIAIDHLKIAGVKLTLRHPEISDGVKEITLADIDLKDVGGSDGLTGPEISLFIVESITKEGMKQAMRQEVEQQADKLIEKGLNSLFNRDDSE